jgi:nitroreductase
MNLILERYSPRAFNPNKQISNEDLLKILKAGQWAQSSFNNQPWRFFVASKSINPNLFEEIYNTFIDFNKLWAKNASVYIVLTCLKEYEHNSNPNNTSLFELGLATQNMVLQALSLNIHSHIIGGFDKEQLSKILNLNDKIECVAVLILGYLDSIDILPEEIKKAEIEKIRTRKNLEEIVFYEPLK